MRGDTRCSRWSVLPEKTTLMPPDLLSRSEPMPKAASPTVQKRNGGSAKEQTPRQQPARANSETKPAASLAPALSGSLRELLLEQVQALDSADAALTWASKSLNAKNSLPASEARTVEEAFRAKIAGFEDETADAETVHAPSLTPEQPEAANAAEKSDASETTEIDKSVLSFPETRRLRDKVHIKWVSTRPCLICGRQPSDPHHLRFAQPRALGRKVSDEFIVPLCRTHHREVHRSSNEVAWWKQAGIDAIALARKLWRETHLLQELGEGPRE
jgi:hypothetical protein